MYSLVSKQTSAIFVYISYEATSQVSYRFLTAENLRLVLSRESFLLLWRGGLVPQKGKKNIFIIFIIYIQLKSIVLTQPNTRSCA